MGKELRHIKLWRHFLLIPRPRMSGGPGLQLHPHLSQRPGVQNLEVDGRRSVEPHQDPQLDRIPEERGRPVGSHQLVQDARIGNAKDWSGEHYVNSSPDNSPQQLVPFYCKMTTRPPTVAPQTTCPHSLGTFSDQLLFREMAHPSFWPWLRQRS